MSTLKISAELSKCLPPQRANVGALKLLSRLPRPFSARKSEENPENVKEAADSVKDAAESISENVKKVSDKVNKTVDTVKEKAAEILSLGAARIATEIVKTKKDANEEELKIKKS